ncbi:MAG TPA: hypothetical protein VFB68_15395 [Xanthobacteraceae bacterium]|nr:hypothetical protein [Xanthobacteraceae bacterium]
MRGVLRLAAGAAMGLAVAGCNLASEGLYFREGIGTGLSRPELGEVTQIQDLYIAHICQQAGLPNCDDVTMSPAAWSLFVEAGMNDVDLRCDAYLAWLDNRKRSATPILNQLAAMNSATQAVMNATGAGAAAITIVGIGFGLAADTFTNVNSRLLLEVNQSTVQSVVLGHQTEYRMQAAKVLVRSRPMAIYLLRNYLRICMPFSIETSINNTVSVYHRAGPDALRFEPLSTRAPQVAAATSSRVVVRSADPLPRQQKVQPKEQQQVALGPAERDLSRTFVANLQRALCVSEPDGILGPSGSRTRRAIREFLAVRTQVPLGSASEIIRGDNIDALQGVIDVVPRCTGSGFLSAWEVAMYGLDRKAAPGAITHMQSRLDAYLKAKNVVLLGPQNKPWAPDKPGMIGDATRAAIAEVRKREEVNPNRGRAMDQDLMDFLDNFRG